MRLRFETKLFWGGVKRPLKMTGQSGLDISESILFVNYNILVGIRCIPPSESRMADLIQDTGSAGMIVIGPA